MWNPRAIAFIVISTLMMLASVARCLAQDRAQLFQLNNQNIYANGQGAITGPILNGVLSQIISGTGNQTDTNNWTGTNNFTGAANITGTGGSTSTSLADRSTYKGVKFDLRSDFGAACDSVHDDSQYFQNMLTAYGSSATPVTVTFPGTCLVDWSNTSISGNLSFEGISGGGLKLASAGQTGAGNFLRWTGAYTVSVKNFTFDLNGFVASGGVAGALIVNPSSGHAALTFDNSSIINASAPTVGNGVLLLSAYSLSSCDVHDSTFSFLATSNYQNESINFGGSGIEIAHCIIRHNHSVNTGMSFAGATYTQVVNNEIDHWGFGGGITFEHIDTTNRHNLVLDNNIHDSLPTIDSNSTYLAGIENWNVGMVIEGNSIYNTCGFGIEVVGDSTVVGNLIGDIGSCQGGLGRQAGIVATMSSPYTGSNSVIVGNKVYDDGPGTTQYGYSDLSGVTGVKLGNNSFNGVLGSYNISGTVSFLSGQIDNRWVNPCAQYDQRNAGAVLTGGSSGFSADQWQYGQSHSAESFTAANPTTIMGQCAYDEKIIVTATRTPSGTDLQYVNQNIGVADVLDFRYGTSQAADAILSFCTRYSGSPPFSLGWYDQNKGSNYTYTGVATILASALARQCFAFKIPGDTAHTLGTTPTNVALRIGFDLGSSSTEQTAPGSWTAGLYFGATTGSALVSQPNGTSLEISDVRLLPGDADQGWLPRSAVSEFQNVQRFAWTTFAPGTAPAAGVGINTGEEQFPASMAATGANIYRMKAPYPMFKPPTTITGYNPVTGSSAACRDETANADGAAVATFANASVLGVTVNCEGNASTVAGNMLGLHVLVDGGL